MRELHDCSDCIQNIIYVTIQRKKKKFDSILSFSSVFKLKKTKPSNLER